MSRPPAPNALRYLNLGFALIRRRELRAFVILPIAANVLLLGGLSWWALAQVDDLNQGLQGWLPEWLGWLRYLLWPLAVAAVLLGVAFTFNLVGTWIAAPFNGLLAERAELLLSGRAVVELSPWQLVRDLPRILGREWQKLKDYLPKALACLLLFLIPLVGQTLAPLLWFLLAAWMAAVQYADYPFDNHQVPYPAMKSMLREQRVTSLAFGSLVTLLTLVPLVNLIIMPVAVCAASAWWVEQFQTRLGWQPARR